MASYWDVYFNQADAPFQWVNLYCAPDNRKQAAPFLIFAISVGIGIVWYRDQTTKEYNNTLKKNWNSIPLFPVLKMDLKLANIKII